MPLPWFWAAPMTSVPVKLVAMIYPRAAACRFRAQGFRHRKTKDLEGKTLADTAFSSVPKLFATYAKAAGLDASKGQMGCGKQRCATWDADAGRVDGIGQFIVGEPLLAVAATPKEVLGLPYADAGLDYYSNGIVAADATTSIQSRPRAPLCQRRWRA